MSLDERHHNWQQTPGGVPMCYQCGVYYGKHESIDCPNPPSHVTELTRLRTLLDDLLRAVKPFAKLGRKIPGGDTDDANEVWWEVFEDDPLTYGDLRRAREAYLKAKGG